MLSMSSGWGRGHTRVEGWRDEAGVAKETERKVYSVHFSFCPYVGVV